MTIEVDLRKRLGDFRLETSFRSEGRLTALFGPSGSGKTSLVNLVAGLVRPDEGRIVVDGAVLADTARSLFVAPHRRRIGYVFQDARLFPHMSVRANLAYGRWFASRTGDGQSLDGVVSLLGIEHLLERRPAALSGGERQRVAIGRALLSGPRLLLMDEPLAALDEARKAEIIPYIERLRDEAGIPILYVSHSVAEVLRLASDMVVLSAGRVAAHGAPADVMRQLDLLPAAAEVEPGRFLDAVVERHDAAYALTVLRIGEAEVFVPLVEAPPGSPLRLRVRARDVMLFRAPPTDTSALNVLPARIVRTSADGAAGMEIALDCAGQELLARVTRRSFDQMGLALGPAVFAVLKSVSFDRRYGVGESASGLADARVPPT